MAQTNRNDSGQDPHCIAENFQRYMQSHGITQDLSPLQRMEKLCGLFEKIAGNAQKISDNLFQGAELERRIADDNGIDINVMRSLLDANDDAVSMLRACLDEMTLSSSKNSRTIVAEYSDTYTEQARRLEEGRKNIDRLCNGVPSP